MRYGQLLPVCPCLVLRYVHVGRVRPDTKASDVVKDLTGCTVIVTGASAGLGKEALRQFAMMNPARLIIAVRSLSRGQAALELVQRETGCMTMEVWEIDLAEFKSVKAFADKALKELDRLDILLENAGLGGAEPIKTKDGWERQLQVNVLSTYWLGLLLLPLLKNTKPLGIKPHLSIVGSWMHYLATANYIHTAQHPLSELNKASNFAKEDYYSLSKLLVLYVAEDLAKKAGSDVIVNVSNPGICTQTEFSTDLPFMYKAASFVIRYTISRNLEQATVPLVWSCLNDTNPAAFTGNCKEYEISNFALSKESKEMQARFIADVEAELAKL